jgi:protein-L-isoaspartate(D-aspartate) O-methyltransferase
MAEGRSAIEEVRRWFAEDLRVTCHLGDERVVAAFAAVPRERFCGPGPWRIRHFVDGYWTTPNNDPHHLYHNVLVALDEARGLNNGEPGLWARHFDKLAIAPGSRVLQIGTGSGYFTAILAELVGATGQVLGFEVDGPLAEAAARNLAPWPQASVRKVAGPPEIEGEWDVIVAFAGLTAPPASWLDALAPGGRALIPLTNDNWWGFPLRVDRAADGLAARAAGTIGIFHADGLRDPAEAAAFASVQADAVGLAALKSLRRDPHDKEDTCWLHGAGWCLSKRELH